MRQITTSHNVEIVLQPKDYPKIDVSQHRKDILKRNINDVYLIKMLNKQQQIHNPILLNQKSDLKQQKPLNKSTYNEYLPYYSQELKFKSSSKPLNHDILSHDPILQQNREFSRFEVPAPISKNRINISVFNEYRDYYKDNYQWKSSSKQVENAPLSVRECKLQASSLKNLKAETIQEYNEYFSPSKKIKKKEKCLPIYEKQMNSLIFKPLMPQAPKQYCTNYARDQYKDKP